MLMEKIERPDNACGLSSICPRCGNGYVCTTVKVGHQAVLLCDLCENEIIDFINHRPKR